MTALHLVFAVLLQLLSIACAMTVQAWTVSASVKSEINFVVVVVVVMKTLIILGCFVKYPPSMNLHGPKPYLMIIVR